MLGQIAIWKPFAWTSVRGEGYYVLLSVWNNWNLIHDTHICRLFYLALSTVMAYRKVWEHNASRKHLEKAGKKGKREIEKVLCWRVNDVKLFVVIFGGFFPLLPVMWSDYSSNLALFKLLKSLVEHKRSWKAIKENGNISKRLLKD